MKGLLQKLKGGSSKESVAASEPASSRWTPVLQPAPYPWVPEEVGPERKASKQPLSGVGSIQPPTEKQVSRALRTKYQYKRLEWESDLRFIRVKLSHGDHGWLNCDFEQDSPYTYEAVSYVWGNPEFVKQVLCDNFTSHINVTQSLFDVLERLVQIPSEYAGRCQYWIDGLCINQENDKERSKQVQKMANIYRRAERVHVFLGIFDADQSSLLESKWFTRRWIIQEAIAAQKVVIHFKMQDQWQSLNSWEELMKKCSSPNVEPRLLSAANFLRELLDTTKTRWAGIFPLLVRFHSAQCLDDCDRLFALFGVSNNVEVGRQPAKEFWTHFDSLKIWFQPDYTMEPDQVFQKFALAALHLPSHFAFDVLHCAGAFRRHNNDTPKTLPTWVPDWRCPLLYKPLMSVSEFRAGLSRTLRKERIVVDGSGLAVIIKGIRLGTIKDVLSGSPDLEQLPESLRLRGNWIDTDNDVEEVESKIELAGNRIQVEITNGLAAIVPVDVEVGDELVTFIGARTPFVLRRTQSDEHGPISYSVIGDCYVFEDRIMTGEALTDSDVLRSLTEFLIV